MEPWVVQSLASIIGGGLAGGALTILYNWLTAKQKADTIEKATIAALIGELRLGIRICEVNAGMRGLPLPTFFRLPIIVTTRAAFEERDINPRLEKLQKELEQYTLGATELNEAINLYQLTFLVNSPTLAPHVINQLRDRIADVSDGTVALRAMGGTDFQLPTFINNLSEQLAQLSKNR